jgi:hypothetical protein
MFGRVSPAVYAVEFGGIPDYCLIRRFHTLSIPFSLKNSNPASIGRLA